MSDSESSASDMEVMNFDDDFSDSSNSSWSSYVSNCSYAAASGERCPFYSAVLQYGNLEFLEIDPDAKGEPFWLHSNDPILMYSAVIDNNLDAVCAMLYYECSIDDAFDIPFEPHSGFCHKSVEIAKVLINFYDDQYLLKKCSYTYNKLVKLLSWYGEHDATLFKLLFRRIDPDDTEQLHYLFVSWIDSARHLLDAADWLECVYLILENITKPLPHLYNQPKSLTRTAYFYHHLFNRFLKKNVQRADRLKIIYICLSFGICPNVWDCEVCYEFYGFGEELEALIYSMNCINYSTASDEIVLLVLPAVSNLNENLFSKVVKDKLSYFERRRWNQFMKFLGFYALSWERKAAVNMECYSEERSLDEETIEVLKRVNQVPEFPTLFELSRDKVREIIYKSVKHPYQFHDSVKQLDLLDCIKDKIRFKIPIY